MTLVDELVQFDQNLDSKIRRDQRRVYESVDDGSVS